MADIRLIARLLAMSSDINLRDFAKLLKEEYGIEAVVEEDKKINDVAEQNNELERAKNCIVIAQNRLLELKNSKPYAPRKIGKPRGFPKNMRRK